MATAAIKTHTVEVVVVAAVEVGMKDMVNKGTTAPETRAEAMAEETTTKTIMVETAAIREASKVDMAVEMLPREETMEVAEVMEIQTMI